MRDAVGVGDVLDGAQGCLGLARHPRLVEHQMASHLGDLGDVLDEHGALVHARPAHGARPERLLADDTTDQGTLAAAACHGGGHLVGRKP